MKLINCFSVVCLLLGSPFAGEKIVDYQVGYSVQLPDGWVYEIADSVHHEFIDTSGTYQSMVAILRTDFSSAVTFSTGPEWTRANFIAYQISIEADPFSTLAFYDTVSAWQNDSIWATDAYTYYFDLDTTIGDWAEYVRFTATGKRGYEIYAIGPASDLDTHIAFYASLIKSITLVDSATEIAIKYTSVPVRFHKPAAPNTFHVNLLGRSLRPHEINAASLLLLAPHKKLLRVR